MSDPSDLTRAELVREVRRHRQGKTRLGRCGVCRSGSVWLERVSPIGLSTDDEHSCDNPQCDHDADDLTRLKQTRDDDE